VSGFLNPVMEFLVPSEADTSVADTSIVLVAIGGFGRTFFCEAA
jgi:hypothetical protein